MQIQPSIRPRRPAARSRRASGVPSPRSAPRCPFPTRPWAAWLAAAAAVPALSGCHLVGPAGLRQGRGLYNEAIVRTANEQLLKNIVRLRYRDAPMFLEVSSVATTLQLAQNAAASVSTNLTGPGDPSLDGGLGLSYLERPTVAYTPLQGADFAVRMLTPLRPRVLGLLANSGWNIDRILMLCVQQVGGLQNAPSASGPTPAREPVYRGFRRLAELLRALQLEHRITISRVAEESENGALAAKPPDELGIEFPPEACAHASFPEILALLGLEARPGDAERGRTVFLSPMVDPLHEPVGGKVFVGTRSLMSILFFLSNAVEVPEHHVERGIVTTTRSADGEAFDWQELLGGFFRIRAGASVDTWASCAVSHRGQRFWIDDADLTSKSSFGLLTQVFALQAGEIEGTGPLLTLPVAQ